MRFGFDLLTGGLPCLLAAALGSQCVNLYYQPLRVQYADFFINLLIFHVYYKHETDIFLIRITNVSNVI